MKCYCASLGCPKNLVDTEIIMRQFSANNIEFVYDPNQADILFINTCAFIKKAVNESLDTILDIASSKKPFQKLVVGGCLVSRYKGEIEKEIKEIDVFIDTNSVSNVNLVKKFNYLDKLNSFNFEERILTTYPYAYLRISEGCFHKCSFCTIPSIRGAYKQKTFREIEKEFQWLLENGVKEIVIIAQDTSYYGKKNLSGLLKRLSNISGEFWIRVLYLYPSFITDELIETISSTPKIVPYFDIPLQHVSDNILKLMGREYDKGFIYELFNKLSKKDVAIRTTFIVGFPGETQENYLELVDFINQFCIDRLGVFEYSNEEGTKASKLNHMPSFKIRKNRRSMLLAMQKKLSQKHLTRFIGKYIDVLVDSPKIARCFLDAPQIDGVVKLKKEREIGTFLTVKITKSSFYDLYE